MWVNHLLIEIRLEHPIPAKLRCDNQVALYIASDLVFHERTKHNDVDQVRIILIRLKQIALQKSYLTVDKCCWVHFSKLQIVIYCFLILTQDKFRRDLF